MACIIKSISVSEDENEFLKLYNLSPSHLLKEKIWEMKNMLSKVAQKKLSTMQGCITELGNENDKLKKQLEEHGII